MAKTLGVVANAALKAIGEAEISVFTSGELLHEALIEEASNSVRSLLQKFRYGWGLGRTTLLTGATITTENAAVTNASTTVSSVTSEGANAQNWAAVTTDHFFRVNSTYNSYAISAVDSSSNPHALTLETDYVDSTDTAAGYTILKDTYDMTATDLGEFVIAQYGDGRGPFLEKVDLSSVYQAAGGDLHRDSSGKPSLYTEIRRDSSGNRRLKFWPYPDSVLLIELQYSPRYTENTTFSTNMFGSGGDAPDIAYDYVEARMCKRACQFDNDPNGVVYWEIECHGNGRTTYGLLGDLIAAEHRDYKGDNAIKIETYRRSAPRGIPGRSQRAFDRSYVRR